MRERLFAYISPMARGAPAARIVAECMNIQGAGDALCERLVGEAVGTDERFFKGPDGLWRTRRPPLFRRPVEAVPVTFVHWVSVPAALGAHGVIEAGFARVEGGRETERHVSLIDPGGPLPPELCRELGLTAHDLRSASRLDPLLKRLVRLARGSMLTVWEERAARTFLLSRLEPSASMPVLFLDRCTRKLVADREPATLADLAACFALPCPARIDVRAGLTLLVEAYSHLVGRLAAKGIRTAEELLAFQDADRVVVDFSRYAFDEVFLASLPESPGVYIMRDKAGEVLYVGKGKNLRARVGSYFAPSGAVDEKRRRILQAVDRIDIEPAATEPEALILEAELIARLRPPINHQVEVHARANPYGKSHDLIVLCPGAPGSVNVLVTARGALLERQTLTEEALSQESMEALVRRHYAGAPRDEHPSEDTLGRELVATWIESNRENLVCVDVELCGGLAHAATIVLAYARDILDGEERVFRV